MKRSGGSWRRHRTGPLPAIASSQAENASTGTAPKATRPRTVSVPDRFGWLVPRMVG